MNNSRILPALLIISTILPGLLAAQETGDAAPRAQIYVIDLSEDSVDQVLPKIFVDRLSEELDSQGFDLVDPPVISHQPVPDWIEDPDTGEINRDSIRPRDFFESLDSGNSDIIIATFLKLQNSNLLIQFALFDPATSTGVGGLFTRGRQGLTLFATVNEAVVELRPVLKDYLTNRYQYVKPQGRVDEIHLSGPQEQVQVFFAGREVGSIAEGELLVPYSPFMVGSHIRMELRKAGYHSKADIIELDKSEMDIRLPPLEREHRFALQTYWTLGMVQGLGLGATTYINPDRSYLLLYHYLHDNEYNIQTIYGVRNYDIGLFYGQYLIFPPGSFIRLSAGFGLGVIRTSTDNNAVEDFTDYYLNLISPTVEANLGNFQVFARAELKYALGLGNNLLGNRWIETIPPIPNISLGVQYKW